MTHHLLDTDTVIDFLHGIASTVAYLAELADTGDTLCTNAIVLCEVYAGLHPQDEQAAERFLAALTHLVLSSAAARQAGRWKYQFRRQGQILSHTDCLIAACAHDHRTTIVTGNVKHFPMPGVTVLPLPRTRA